MATRAELGEQARLEVGRSLMDLEPSAIIELYELYFDVNLEPFRFHAGTNNLYKNIIWNGNSYYPSAIEVEGFEANILGRLPRPKVTVANEDYVISSILRDYSDFRNGKFTRIKLFLKHLDSINFDGGENPFGEANSLMYISKEKYIISQKIIENKQIIQFELITPFDLESLQTATRSIYGRYCYWQYRGMGCGYQGDLISKENDSDFDVKPNQNIKNEFGKLIYGTQDLTIEKFLWTIGKEYFKGDVVCVRNIDFNGYKDPKITWFVCIFQHISDKYSNPNKSKDLWQQDNCSKSINACKKRFSQENYKTSINGFTYIAINDSLINRGILPFGGFPGTDTFRYE